MIHLIWTGCGYLVPAVTFASCLLMELTTRAVFQDDTYYQEHCWPIPVALAIAGVVCVFLVHVFSRGEPRTLINVETRKQIVLHPSLGTFFFVPMRYWGPILFLCAAVVAIYQIAHGKI